MIRFGESTIWINEQFIESIDVGLSKPGTFAQSASIFMVNRSHKDPFTLYGADAEAVLRWLKETYPANRQVD